MPWQWMYKSIHLWHKRTCPLAKISKNSQTWCKMFEDIRQSHQDINILHMTHSNGDYQNKKASCCNAWWVASYNTKLLTPSLFCFYCHHCCNHQWLERSVLKRPAAINLKLYLHFHWNSGGLSSVFIWMGISWRPLPVWFVISEAGNAVCGF